MPFQHHEGRPWLCLPLAGAAEGFACPGAHRSRIPGEPLRPALPCETPSARRGLGREQQDEPHALLPEPRPVPGLSPALHSSQEPRSTLNSLGKQTDPGLCSAGECLGVKPLPSHLPIPPCLTPGCRGTGSPGNGGTRSTGSHTALGGRREHAMPLGDRNMLHGEGGLPLS